MLVELRLVEQRYQAVLEVLDGATVTDVARRYGVARQTVHVWLRRYGAGGLAGLADGTSKPQSCPHQMAPAIEARIVEMRTEHPDWGPRTILYWLAREGADPLPGRTSIERCLIRHGLVNRTPRRRRRSDYKRWERSRSMELWQMDIVGGVRIVDPDTGEVTEAKIVSGIDDHSRFVGCFALPTSYNACAFFGWIPNIEYSRGIISTLAHSAAAPSTVFASFLYLSIWNWGQYPSYLPGSIGNTGPTCFQPAGDTAPCSSGH
jgi:transposase